MGLDMYAHAVKKEAWDGKEVDCAAPENKDHLETFQYWRKHHDLHGWMHHLYTTKGGLDESFNLTTVRLTEDDLFRLADDLVGKSLPATTGFFFGNNPPNPESDSEDLAFIVTCLRRIKNGEIILYSAWY